MKKILYLIPLVIALTLTGCANTQDSTAQEAQTAAASQPSDTPSSLDLEQSQSESAKDALLPPSAENSSRLPEDSVKSSADSTEPKSSDKKALKETDEAKSNNAEQNTEPKYTVTKFETPKTMYSSTSLNVRKGPSTDFEKIGALKRGEEVTVTGRADTDWYEIQYGQDSAFVSNEYLQNEKPADEPKPETQETETPQPDSQTQEPQPADAPAAEVQNAAGVIMVGDSRFVQMKNSVGDNPCTWIAESSKGYKWFSENAIPRIDSCVGNGSKILINLGVNDVGNLQKYITLVNAKAEEWVGKGAVVYYSSVNPVWENPYVTEEQVEYFNSQMQSNLSGNIHWLDSHSYLISTGYRLVDGLHYSTETYQNLYAYYMGCM